MSPWMEERHAVLETAKALAQRGLVVGTSGNVSLRLADRHREVLAITPSGREYAGLQVEDIVVIDFEGDPVEGELIPSTETLTHVAIYLARPDVQSVIHTHSLYASVAAVAGLEIPPIVDEMAIATGGPVKVAQYAFPSSEELAQRAVAALDDRKAVLLRNHGLVGVGSSLKEALRVCELVERVAHIFIGARLVGQATPLPQEVVEAEVELYRMRLTTETPTKGVTPP